MVVVVVVIMVVMIEVAVVVAMIETRMIGMFSTTPVEVMMIVVGTLSVGAASVTRSAAVIGVGPACDSARPSSRRALPVSAAARVLSSAGSARRVSSACIACVRTTAADVRRATDVSPATAAALRERERAADDKSEYRRSDDCLEVPVLESVEGIHDALLSQTLFGQ